MVELTSSQKAELFKLLDHYSKTKHRCFVAEMDLNKSKSGYSVCFRPFGARIGSVDRYACIYVQIDMTAAATASDSNSLGESLINLLDARLAQLNPRNGETV